MQLLLGCGSNRIKKVHRPDHQEWDGLVTVDIESRHNPDVVHDLNQTLPFPNDSVTEIHIYEVLEHFGRQGDAKAFFNTFSDFWRVLKHDGLVFGTVPLPTSPWAWGDPSHTRVIPKESFVFLNQPSYSQVGITAMSDFRGIYKADFDVIHTEESGDVLVFALKAVKPSRIE